MLSGDHESGVADEQPRRVLGLFRRRDAEPSAALPTEPHSPTEKSEDGSSMAASVPAQDEVVEHIVVQARLTAENLVAQGQTELMRARAEAADIQAEARERLVEVIGRELAVDDTEPTAADSAGQSSIGEAQRHAMEIVSNARRSAIGLLEEAQQLLAASRLQASSSPGCEHCNTSSAPEPGSRPDEPVIVIDLTTDERASRYARQSANLPKIGVEAGNTLANMRRLRESSKGQDR